MQTLESPPNPDADSQTTPGTSEDFVVYNPRPDKCERRRRVRYTLIGDIKLEIEGKWWTGELVDRSFVGFQVVFPVKAPISPGQVLRLSTDSGECWVRVVYADSDAIAGLEWLEDADGDIPRSTQFLTGATAKTFGMNWTRIAGIVSVMTIVAATLVLAYVGPDLQHFMRLLGW